MTQPGAPRDIDLTEWLRSAGYLPADTDLKRLAHEAVRALIAEIGAHLHYILPPGDDKTHTFRVLRDVLMWANATLAVGGGPNPDKVTAGSLRALMADRLGDAARPADPRVADAPSESQQLADRIRDRPVGPQGFAFTGLTAPVPGDIRGGQPVGLIHVDIQVDEPGDRASALEDRVYALLRSTLSDEYEINAVDFRRAAKAIVRAIAEPGVITEARIETPQGYISPFKPVGHEGEHHALRFHPDPEEKRLREHQAGR